MKIGIVNDLPAVATLLQRVVGIDPDNRVIWIAKSGAEAVALCAKETPDLILMDIVMPEMDGVETTRRIMASSPCAILIVTGSMQMTARPIFEAMGQARSTPSTRHWSGLGNSKTAPAASAKITAITRLVSDKRGARRAAEPAIASRDHGTIG